jgi:hypothetical protein
MARYLGVDLIMPPLHITQHKRFVPNGTHPNFCFAKTSFMLGTLGEIERKSQQEGYLNVPSN